MLILISIVLLKISIVKIKMNHQVPRAPIRIAIVGASNLVTRFGVYMQCNCFGICSRPLIHVTVRYYCFLIVSFKCFQLPICNKFLIYCSYIQARVPVVFRVFATSGARLTGEGDRNFGTLISRALAWAPDVLFIYPDIVMNSLTLFNGTVSTPDILLGYLVALRARCHFRAISLDVGLTFRRANSPDVNKQFNLLLKESSLLTKLFVKQFIYSIR